jgi:Cu2+-containing amine oxidase
VLTEDKRLSQMAKVGRYRVVTVEPLTVKQPMSLAGHRLARIVIYDYASDRCIDGCVDLDQSVVATLRFTRAQPMLARDEEAAAISIALADDRVKAELSLSDEAQAAMHYWSDRDTDLAFSRRSAAVIFGRPGARPSLMAIVDLLDGQVSEVIPAGSW